MERIKVYHISHSKNRDSILTNGLLLKEHKGSDINYTPKIFISTLKEDDISYDYVGYENVDCWEFEVDSSELIKDENSDSENHFSITREIKSSEIKLSSYK